MDFGGTARPGLDRRRCVAFFVISCAVLLGISLLIIFLGIVNSYHDITKSLIICMGESGSGEDGTLNIGYEAVLAAANELLGAEYYCHRVLESIADTDEFIEDTLGAVSDYRGVEMLLVTSNYTALGDATQFFVRGARNNMDFAEPDANGAQPHGEAIDPVYELDAFLPAPADACALAAQVQAGGVAVDCADDAGTGLANYFFFRAIQAFDALVADGFGGRVLLAMLVPGNAAPAAVDAAEAALVEADRLFRAGGA